MLGVRITGICAGSKPLVHFWLRCCVTQNDLEWDMCLATQGLHAIHGRQVR